MLLRIFGFQFCQLSLLQHGMNDKILMIGDDITSDIEGSINANLKAIQVKTGKFQEKDLKYATQPNYRIKSITDLPRLLGF